MGKRKLSDEKAKKVAGFLLDEGISQAKIAATIERSPSWVSDYKKQRETFKIGAEFGKQGLQNEIVENVEKNIADKLINKMNPELKKIACIIKDDNS